MRVIVSLCLLHVAFGFNSWPTQSENEDPVCLSDHHSCGCCLMQNRMDFMESYFNKTYNALSNKLKESKMALNMMRESRSAFSVALEHTDHLSCIGPFDTDTIIKYQQSFINLGDGYNAQTGVFTAPRSGVYSLALTVYNAHAPGDDTGPCANLEVNGKVVASLIEHNAQDSEDSGTVVLSVKLMAGDMVAVKMPAGCRICENDSHFNTFTGFLLYVCD